MQEDWKENPKLKGLDKGKLDLLQSLAEQGTQKNASDLLPFLMQAAASGKQKGLQFSSNEISTILEVLKMGKSPEEAARMDRIVRMMQMIH